MVGKSIAKIHKLDNGFRHEFLIMKFYLHDKVDYTTSLMGAVRVFYASFCGCYVSCRGNISLNASKGH